VACLYHEITFYLYVQLFVDYILFVCAIVCLFTVKAIILVQAADTSLSSWNAETVLSVMGLLDVEKVSIFTELEIRIWN